MAAMAACGHVAWLRRGYGYVAWLCGGGLTAWQRRGYMALLLTRYMALLLIYGAAAEWRTYVENEAGQTMN